MVESKPQAQIKKHCPTMSCRYFLCLSQHQIDTAHSVSLILLRTNISTRQSQDGTRFSFRRSCSYRGSITNTCALHVSHGSSVRSGRSQTKIWRGSVFLGRGHVLNSRGLGCSVRVLSLVLVRVGFFPEIMKIRVRWRDSFRWWGRWWWWLLLHRWRGREAWSRIECLLGWRFRIHIDHVRFGQWVPARDR